MHSTNLRASLWCFFALATVAGYGADSWQDAQIMPKSSDLLLQVGGPAPRPPVGRTVVPSITSCTGTVDDIEWPARVEVVEGQWLWIEDHGGYRSPAAAGWVSCDEVLKLPDPNPLKPRDALAYYMGELKRTKNAPWLHWALGICLQTTSQTQTAREEYQQAIKAGPPNTGDLFEVSRQNREEIQNFSRMLEANVAQDAPKLPAERTDIAWYVYDAKVRLERLNAQASKSAADAEHAATQILTAIGLGYRRPYAYWEAADALKRAYQNELEEDQDTIVKDGNLLDRLKQHKMDLIEDLKEYKRHLCGLKAASKACLQEGEAKLKDDLDRVREDIEGQKAIKGGSGCCPSDSFQKDVERLKHILSTIAPQCQSGKLQEKLTKNGKLLECKLKKLKCGARNFDANVEHLEKKIRKLEGDIGDQVGRIQRLADTVRRLESQLQKMEADISKLSGQGCPCDDNVKQLECDLGKFGADIKRLSKDGASVCGKARQAIVIQVETLLKNVRQIELALDQIWAIRLLGWVRAEIEVVRRCDGKKPCGDSGDRTRCKIANEENLLTRADRLYRLAVSLPNGDPNWFKGYLGRADIRLTRVLDLRSDAQTCDDETNDLVSEKQGLVEGERGLNEPGATLVSKVMARPARAEPTSRRTARDVNHKRAPRVNAEHETPPCKEGCCLTTSLVSFLQTAADDLRTTAGGRLDKVICFCDKAIRRNPAQAQPCRDQAEAYLIRAHSDPDYADAKHDLDRVITKLVRIQKSFTPLAGNNRAKDEAARKKFNNAFSHLQDVQATLSNIGDLSKALRSAHRACELVEFKDDRESLETLATAFAMVGDYTRAEYYENRAAYYAIYNSKENEKLPALLQQREVYRKSIPLDNSNPPWRDARIDLNGGILPPLPTGK